MADIVNEITKLEPMELYYIGDRHKTFFEYPAHCHEEYELNFIENAAGVRRIVGDSTETIGNLELVLITGPKLIHVWEQGECPEREIYELTMHISPEIFSEPLISKRPLTGIKEMIIRAQRGLCFSEEAIMEVRHDLQVLKNPKDKFDTLSHFLHLLFTLAEDKGAHELASTSYSNSQSTVEDRRISMIREYMASHYQEDMSVSTLSKLVCMTPESFSRFFHHHTGKTPAHYIIDYRLGIAARMLLQTQLPVQDICFACGFNTVSHFNRLFKAAKGYTPSEFRERF
ncbi:MAG: AraC family transcriptional regulator [Paludibacteraceae bacterium]|nr:AraC family transcriptional regulator [Paludibacteraceae bacterium]